MLTNVRIVYLFINVGLMITVLHIVKNPQSYKPKLSYPKHAKRPSKIKAIETGIILLIDQVATVMFVK